MRATSSLSSSLSGSLISLYRFKSPLCAGNNGFHSTWHQLENNFLYVYTIIKIPQDFTYGRWLFGSVSWRIRIWEEQSTGYICYQVQVHSARCRTGQWLWEMRGWGKEETLWGGRAQITDWEDARLAPQNTHLFGVWMPGSFLGQGWKGEEAK